jgi:hypothetical protein
MDLGYLDLTSNSSPLSYDVCLQSQNNLIFIVYIPPGKKTSVCWNATMDEYTKVLLDEVKWTT